MRKRRRFVRDRDHRQLCRGVSCFYPSRCIRSLASASGLGAFRGGHRFLACAKRNHSLPRLLARFSILWLALALGLAAAVPHFASLFIGWVFAGVGMAVLGIRSNEELAAHSVDEERAHVYAAHFSLSHACWGIFYPLSGFLSTRIGFQPAAVVFLVILGVVSLILLQRATGFQAGNEEPDQIQ